MAHSFHVYLVPSIVVGVLLTCQSLDPEYKMTAFSQMYFQEKTSSYIRVKTVHIRNHRSDIRINRVNIPIKLTYPLSTLSFLSSDYKKKK